MPQHDYMEQHRKKHGERLDREERLRKKEAREVHRRSRFAQKVHGLRAKLYNAKRYKEKAQMRKTLAMHQEKTNKHANEEGAPEGAVPAYLIDREGVSRAKVLSNTVKQKRAERAGKWSVPLPKVKPVADDEMFRVMQSGKRKAKSWKRMVTKNPSSPMYTTLGVITKGTVIEVNVSELGLVTTSGKVVWGKYAQVTNNPELDGCINAVLLV
ncbi:ribosome biogenesis protein nsa2 [Nannochloropsis oceanica]